MNPLEQRFLETMPVIAREITEQLKDTERDISSVSNNLTAANVELYNLNQTLNKIADALTQLNETLNYRL